MHELALFAGAGGGGILGSFLLGHTTVCAVEIDPYCRRVLLSRQRDGILPRFPIWDDVRTFDGYPWHGHIDVISGGFPCQDVSSAGTGKGLAGSRSGLVFEMLRIVDEVRPKFVFAENSPMLRTRGLDTILKEFASMGYDARWCVLGAWHVGAPHKRDRMWILAYDHLQQCNKWRKRDRSEQETPRSEGWWSDEPDVGRVVYGLANRVDRARALGNGQVPRVAALAWRILSEEMS